MLHAYAPIEMSERAHERMRTSIIQAIPQIFHVSCFFLSLSSDAMNTFMFVVDVCS